MQAGTQAAQRFHGRVGRGGHRQQVLATIGHHARTVLALAQLGQGVGHAERDRGVDRQAQGLDVRRVFDARVEHALEEDEGDREETAE